MWRSGVDLWLAWVEVSGVDGPMKTDMVCENLCIICKHTLEIIHLGRRTKQPRRENDFYSFKHSS